MEVFANTHAYPTRLSSGQSRLEILVSTDLLDRQYRPEGQKEIIFAAWELPALTGHSYIRPELAQLDYLPRDS